VAWRVLLLGQKGGMETARGSVHWREAMKYKCNFCVAFTGCAWDHDRAHQEDPPMIRTLETAQVDLAPLMGRLRACIQGALQDFVERFREARSLMSKRSVASLIHDCMRVRCEREFPKGIPTA
jgi:hypothetical protein